MLIGLDASRANKIHKTGTEWYSYYLIEYLKKLDSRNHYFLYSKEPLIGDLGRLPVNWESRVLAWPPKYLWTQIRLSFEMARRAPDLLFVPAHAIPMAHPKNIVTTCHDIGFEHFPELYSRAELHYHRFAMRLAARRAKKIITPSEFTKNEMARTYGVAPEKFQVIYHGFDRAKYRAIEDQSAIEGVLKKYKITKPFILYIGRLEKKKNTAGLVEAFQELRSKNSASTKVMADRQELGDLKLVLVGQSGFGFAEVEEKIKKYNLADKIIMPGWVGADDLPYLLNAAEVFVFPSFYEGFGLPVLEAMACGTPVVASRVTSIPEVGGEAIEYFNPQDIAEMAEKMRKVLADPNLRADLRSRGLERAKQFSWEKCAEETLRVLEGMKRK